MRFVLVMALACSVSATGAQTLFKCPSGGGGAVFQQTPCNFEQAQAAPPQYGRATGNTSASTTEARCRSSADRWANWVVKSRNDIAKSQVDAPSIQADLLQSSGSDVRGSVESMSRRATLLLTTTLIPSEVKANLHALCMSMGD